MIEKNLLDDDLKLLFIVFEFLDVASKNMINAAVFNMFFITIFIIAKFLEVFYK